MRSRSINGKLGVQQGIDVRGARFSKGMEIRSRNLRQASRIIRDVSAISFFRLSVADRSRPHSPPGLPSSGCPASSGDRWRWRWIPFRLLAEPMWCHLTLGCSSSRGCSDPAEQIGDLAENSPAAIAVANEDEKEVALRGELIVENRVEVVLRRVRRCARSRARGTAADRPCG